MANTLTARQIANIPIQGRGAFDLVGLMPGVVSSTGSNRDANVIGLPQATVNITLDGMNIQDNYAKSWDGMFTRVSPRIDAVEEVTVSTAAQGADTAGQGAVQVKFVTRSGTNTVPGERLLLPAARLDEHEHVVQRAPQRRSRTARRRPSPS